MHKAILLTLPFYLFTHFTSTAQRGGCPDPFAENYHVLNQGSCDDCQYKKIELNREAIGRMPNEVKETSGLLSFNGELWTINDSGDGPFLYQLDETGEKVIRKVWVNGAKNKDWEELTQDSSRIYIGDFGNNEGSRDKLVIYVVEKKDLNRDTVQAERIKFSYPEQKDFNHRNRAHNFDCEAMVCIRDTLHLFTKNWTNRWTKHYILPNKPGKFSAQFIDSFNIQMLVTGACWLPTSNAIALIGYTVPNDATIWIFRNINTNKIFAGPRRKIDLGNMADAGQVEAVTANSNYEMELYFSNEDFNGVIAPHLQKIDINSLLNSFPPGGLSAPDVNDFNLSANQLEGYLNVELIMKHDDSVFIQLYSKGGKLIGQPVPFAAKRGYNQFKLPMNENTIPGEYLVLIFNEERGIAGMRFSW